MQMNRRCFMTGVTTVYSVSGASLGNFNWDHTATGLTNCFFLTTCRAWWTFKYVSWQFAMERWVNHRSTWITNIHFHSYCEILPEGKPWTTLKLIIKKWWISVGTYGRSDFWMYFFSVVSPIYCWSCGAVAKTIQNRRLTRKILGLRQVEQGWTINSG